jgi:hypothetical protein
VPDWLHVLARCQHGPEVEADLAEKLVGPEAIIVPHGDLQDSGPEVHGSDPGIDEALVPLWATGVDQRLGTPLRKLSVIVGVMVVGEFLKSMSWVQREVGLSKVEVAEEREN